LGLPSDRRRRRSSCNHPQRYSEKTREIADYCESDVLNSSSTNCFAGGCRMPPFSKARRTLPTSWRREATRSRT